LFSAISVWITSCFGGRYAPFFIAKNTPVFTLFVQWVFSFSATAFSFHFFALIFVQILFYLCIKVYLDLWSMLVFIKRVVSKRFEWCWKREKVSCKKVVQKRRSLFRLRLRLLHVMLEVVLIVCLVVFAVAWLVSNDWDCLMSLWKNHVLFYYVEAFIWFSPLIIWVDVAHAYNMFDSYKVAISLYDHLVFDLWCHFMLILMMFCRYAWLWPLLLS
jgi:hypothetical protein